jgi:hypothetical protein
LHDPIVETFRSNHPNDWFGTGDGFFSNVVNEASRLAGAKYDDDHHRWLVYADVDHPCGQGGGTAAGISVFPANDLRGLAGQPRRAVCPHDVPDQDPRCRWVGGMGHELGHGFGMPHPANCTDSNPSTLCPQDSIMWMGVYSYPDASLTLPERRQLSGSPFFSWHMLSDVPSCATY